MPALEELKKSIVKITRCSEEEIKPETALKDIRADSLHWVQIIVSVETALDIEVDIDNEKMQELETVADFVKYIETFMNQ